MLGLAFALALAWLSLIVLLLTSRVDRTQLTDAVRVLPDTLRLLKRLATDRALPVGIRVRLWLLFAYVASPIDLIPDFIPVLGFADDVIIVCLVLRSIVRTAGPEAVRKHWPGSDEGLSAVWRAARLPGVPPTN